MFDHHGFAVTDLAASKAFFLKALAPLHVQVVMEGPYGVGMGRNFADMDQLSALATLPVGTRWLLTPELTVLRQGEGEITDPFPATSAEAGDIPQLFIGVVERTWRAAVAVTGRQGPLDLRASAGFHHVVNAGHEEGRTVDRFEGRLQATVGLSGGGSLR